MINSTLVSQQTNTTTSTRASREPSQPHFKKRLFDIGVGPDIQVKRARTDLPDLTRVSPDCVVYDFDGLDLDMILGAVPKEVEAPEEFEAKPSLADLDGMVLSSIISFLGSRDVRTLAYASTQALHNDNEQGSELLVDQPALEDLPPLARHLANLVQQLCQPEFRDSRSQKVIKAKLCQDFINQDVDTTLSKIKGMFASNHLNAGLRSFWGDSAQQDVLFRSALKAEHDQNGKICIESDGYYQKLEVEISVDEKDRRIGIITVLTQVANAGIDNVSLDIDLSTEVFSAKNFKKIVEKLNSMSLSSLSLNLCRHCDPNDLIFTIKRDHLVRTPIIKQIVTLKNLRGLRFDNSGITNDHVMILVDALKDLEYLSLRNCVITRGALEHLAGLAALKFLDLSACPWVSDEALQHLVKHLPNLKVVR